MTPATVLYLIVAFGFALLFWGMAWLVVNDGVELPLIPLLVTGAFGPFVAAGLCTWRDGGLGHMMRFYGRAFAPRMGWAAFLLAILLMPALAIVAAALYGWQTGQPLTIQMTWSALPAAYLWLFVFGGALGEEFGWSFLSDRLDEVLPVERATLLLGVVWALWHVPLFFIVAPGLTQHFTPFWVFLISSIAMRFMFSWAYHRSGNNILSNLLFHNSANLAINIVAIAPVSFDDDHRRLWYYTALTVLCAILLWHLFPRTRCQTASNPNPRLE